MSVASDNVQVCYQCPVKSQRPLSVPFLWDNDDSKDGGNIALLMTICGISKVTLVVKNPPANVRDAGLILELGRSAGVGNSTPTQYSCLEISMDYFFGRNDAKTEAPVLWPPHAKSWLIGKDWCWRDWGQEKKGMMKDEMARCYHRLDGPEFEWTPGAGEGQGGLACCDSWGHKELDTTERLNWAEDMKTTLVSIGDNW